LACSVPKFENVAALVDGSRVDGRNGNVGVGGGRLQGKKRGKRAYWCDGCAGLPVGRAVVVNKAGLHDGFTVAAWSLRAST